MLGHARRQDLPGLPATKPASEGVVQLRVRYSECDPMNVAHHASYVPWLEMGRTELLRSSGVSYAQLEAAGVFLVIVKLEVKYRRPVLYDDMVEIRTRVSGAGKVKIEHAYDVVVVERHGKPASEVAALAATTLGCVDRDGRVRQLPEWLSGT